jgi:ParB-like chromosome segregation protein Spo0J
MQKNNLKIEYVSIKSLIPYELNNRIHADRQVDRIANSISEYGFNQPIIIDEKNIILVGHGRWMAAKKLGLDNVPVFKKTDLSEAQKKAYRIVDNKTSSDGSYDFKNLELDLQALDEMEYDFEPFGLSELLPEPYEADQDEDEAEVPVELDPLKSSVSITLIVPLDEKDSFQHDLNDLLKKYHRVIQKGIKRKEAEDERE